MKNWYAKDRYTEDEFIKICNDSESMSKAAAKLGMHFNTFKRHALKLNCYNTNQAGKYVKKKGNGSKIPLGEIIYDNLHPNYQTYKLKLRLLKENIFNNKCSNNKCGIVNWNEMELNMELDHIDGNKTNHHISNLRMLCPNCHAQTPTYRAKNRN